MNEKSTMTGLTSICHSSTGSAEKQRIGNKNQKSQKKHGWFYYSWSFPDVSNNQIYETLLAVALPLPMKKHNWSTQLTYLQQ